MYYSYCILVVLLRSTTIQHHSPYLSLFVAATSCQVFARERAVAWLRNVKNQDLESLGGDPNRIYQLLVEGKGTNVNSFETAIAILNVASKRWDLVSTKQW